MVFDDVYFYAVKRERERGRGRRETENLEPGNFGREKEIANC